MRSQPSPLLFIDNPKHTSNLFSELVFRRRELGMKMLSYFHQYLNLRCKPEQSIFMLDILANLRSDYYYFIKSEIIAKRPVSMFEYACYTLIAEDIHTLDIHALECLYDYFTNQHEHAIRYNLRVQLAARKWQDATSCDDKSFLGEDLRQAFIEFDEHMAPSRSFHGGYFLNLESANLSGVDLNTLNLRFINFSYANLAETGLYDSVFLNCCLDGAALHQNNGLLPVHNIVMAQCTAINANFKSSDIIDLSLTSCDMTDAKLGTAKVTVHQKLTHPVQYEVNIDWEKFVDLNDLRAMGYLYYLNNPNPNVLFTPIVLSNPSYLLATLDEIFKSYDGSCKEISYHVATSLIFHIEKSELKDNEKLSLIETAMCHPALQSGVDFTSLWERSPAQAMLEKSRSKLIKMMTLHNTNDGYLSYIV